MKAFTARAALVVLLSSSAFACGDGGTATSKSSDAKAEKETDKKSASPTSSSAPSGSAAASTLGSDEVAITKRVAAVGDIEKGSKTSTSEMKAKIKSPKGEVDVDVTETESIDKTEECLAVADKQCSKAKVTFTKYEQKKLVNGQPKEEGKPAVGKAYIIERKGKDLLVTLEDGSAPPPAEETKLKKQFKRFGRHKDVSGSLPDKVKVGDSLDAFAKVLGEEAAVQDDDDQEAPPKVVAKVTVKSIREEGGKKIVTCDVTVTIEGDSKKIGHMKLEMKGTMDFRADVGQPVASDLGGPMAIDFANDGGKGAGTLKEKTSSTLSF